MMKEGNKIERKNRKGQIAVFVVIALVILGLAALFYIFYSPSARQIISDLGSRSTSSEIMPVQNLMEDCIYQRSVDAIRIVGLQGGYIHASEKSIQTSFAKVAYGYYEGSKNLPTRKKVQEEISSYVKSTIPLCVYREDLNDFSVDIKDPIVTTKINNENVIVSARVSASITKANITYDLDKTYASTVLVRLGDMMDVANQIVDKEIKDPDYIPLSYLAGTNYNILSMPADDDNLVYAIVDISNKSSPGGVSYSFVFANKF